LFTLIHRSGAAEAEGAVSGAGLRAAGGEGAVEHRFPVLGVQLGEQAGGGGGCCHSRLLAIFINYNYTRLANVCQVLSAIFFAISIAFF
jgi:hypothetical protein